MSMEESRLDGNAAAGLLADVFTLEATAARITCAGCGAEGAVATAHVYGAGGPGVVVRCPGCEGVLMRFARVRGEVHADLRGVGALVFADTA
jgi:Family of unknown function (DUF6510)